VYWLDRDEIDVKAGRCLTELRQPKKARRRCTTGTSRRRLRPRSRHCTVGEHEQRPESGSGQSGTGGAGAVRGERNGGRIRGPGGRTARSSR
jgi:hypothetical protein